MTAHVPNNASQPGFSDPNALSPSEALEMFRTRPVMVAGAGVAGRGVLTMLKRLDATVCVVDDHAPEGQLTVAEATEQVRGEHAPAVVITSPGWRPDSELLRTASAAGIPVIGDIEAAWLADQAGAFGEPRTWLAITGTNGKTTATAMLTAMLVADGKSALAVGNIGTSPAVALARPESADTRVDYLVAEVSSFQLHWAPTFAPNVGCVLNLADDHLDWHGSFRAYAQDKVKVLRGDVAVLAVGERAVMDHLPAPRPGTVNWAYTTGDPRDVSEDSALDNRELSDVVGVIGDEISQRTATGELASLASSRRISPPGPAGIADACASAAMARAIGVRPESIASALKSFQVQAHRGQVVYENNGVAWIDNSKATNPHAAAAALRGQRDVIWVAGGQLKGADIVELIEEVAPTLTAAIVLGKDRKDISAELGRRLPDLPVVSIETTDPAEAMKEVACIAHGIAKPGDTVMLAPAAASLDMFTGMSHRGDLFAQSAISEDPQR